MKVPVILPTHNEADNIKNMVNGRLVVTVPRSSLFGYYWILVWETSGECRFKGKRKSARGLSH